MTDPRDLLRSYLRQRQELGEEELVLDRLSAADLQALLSARPAAPAARTPAGADPRRESPSADPRREAPPAEPRRESAVAAVPAERPERVDTHVRAGAPVPGTAPHPPSPRAPAAYVSEEEISSLPILSQVREIALGCPRCGLARTRTHVVFGEGREDADILVVGEAPGQDEDRSGRPFVGRAGKLLDLVLQSAGFARDDVYICNVLKCRPPQNRNPQPDEVSACSPYLLKQVELVQPRVILAFGAFAAQTLLGTDISIGKLRGR
ncbi:MAG TPA: uracil-DNA glycosylase family protein, partial [Longimicrobium sp.]|nr:uracil-DNA glycosylase family protein [Longimicrobium sp.]